MLHAVVCRTMHGRGATHTMAGNILHHIRKLRSLRSSPFRSLPSFSRRTSVAWQTRKKKAAVCGANNSIQHTLRRPTEGAKVLPFFLKVRGGCGGRAKTSFSEKRSFRSPPAYNLTLSGYADKFGGVEVGYFMEFFFGEDLEGFEEFHAIGDACG